MGAYKYLEELWKKKQSDVLKFLLRIRCWESGTHSAHRSAGSPSLCAGMPSLSSHPRQATAQARWLCVHMLMVCCSFRCSSFLLGTVSCRLCTVRLARLARTRLAASGTRPNRYSKQTAHNRALQV